MTRILELDPWHLWTFSIDKYIKLQLTSVLIKECLHKAIQSRTLSFPPAAVIYMHLLVLAIALSYTFCYRHFPKNRYKMLFFGLFKVYHDEFSGLTRPV